MILRGQIFRDQLLFEAEIERAAKRKKKRQRQKRGNETLDKSPQPLFLFSLIFFQEESNMA